MENKKILILGAVALLLVAIGLYLAFNNSNNTDTDDGDATEQIEGEAIDTALDFYDAWLAAVSAADKSPYTEGTLEYEGLTTDMRNKILAAQSDFEQNLSDPVLCQPTPPSGIRSKVVLEQEANAQILILGPRQDAQAFALVKLVGEDGRWKISDIDCNAGETAPEVGEFNFEQTGFLLKQSVQPPLDPNNWYVVYESEGVMGYTAVLHFTESSVCTAADGSPITCGDDFFEAMQARVLGDVTEAGVAVARVEVVE